jgi:hypothetical protein
MPTSRLWQIPDVHSVASLHGAIKPLFFTAGMGLGCWIPDPQTIRLLSYLFINPGPQLLLLQSAFVAQLKLSFALPGAIGALHRFTSGAATKVLHVLDWHSRQAVHVDPSGNRLGFDPPGNRLAKDMAVGGVAVSMKDDSKGFCCLKPTRNPTERIAIRAKALASKLVGGVLIFDGVSVAASILRDNCRVGGDFDYDL